MYKAINNYEKSFQARNLASTKLGNATSNYNYAVSQKNSINVNNYKVGVYNGDVVTYTQVCNGHKGYSTAYWSGDANDEVNDWYWYFRKHNANLKSYTAWKDDQSGIFDSDYTITAKWSHIDNAPTCQVKYNIFGNPIYHIKECDNYTVVPKITKGNITYKVTAESHRQYNAAILKAEQEIAYYQKQMNQASYELSNVEREVANYEREINSQMQNARTDLQKLLKEQEGLTNSKINLQNQIENQKSTNQILGNQIKSQRDLILSLEKTLMEGLAEKTKLEYKEVLLVNEVITKERINEDLLEIIKLLESRIYCTSEQNIELERLVKNQDQIYRDLCKSAIKAKQDLLDKVKILTPEGRAYLLMESIFNNDLNKEMIERYTLSMGIDVDYLAMIAFESNNMEIFKYALSIGANPINYSKDNITLLQKMIQAGKAEYIDLIMNDKSMNQLGATILSAIKANDLVTIDKLLLHNHNLFSDKILGINIMQIVIYTNNDVLLYRILSTNPELINLTDPVGKSLLYTALKYSNDNMILKILNSELVNIQDQVEILILNNETDLLADLANICNKNQIEFLNDDIKGKLHEYNISLDELDSNNYIHIKYDFSHIDYKTEIDLLLN